MKQNVWQQKMLKVRLLAFSTLYSKLNIYATLHRYKIVSNFDCLDHASAEAIRSCYTASCTSRRVCLWNSYGAQFCIIFNLFQLSSHYHWLYSSLFFVNNYTNVLIFLTMCVLFTQSQQQALHELRQFLINHTYLLNL